MAFRLPNPNIILSFDGSTKGGNPGQGGAAAIIYVDGVPDSRVSNRMGVVGNNCAEYYGLILGLRELLHLFPTMEYDLTIKGDSELVIKQLDSKYQVRDDVLKNYYHVAKGLLARISKMASSIRLLQVPREENRDADNLAKEATALQIRPNFRFWHYPCLNSFLDATIKGTESSLHVKVAHDYGAAAYTPEILIDATILRQCYGDAALEIIRSTGKKNLIQGKTDMTVLGITSLQFTMGHGDIKVYNAHVVDFLPWPLQISGDHPACTNDKLFGSGDEGYTCSGGWRSKVPTRFQGHPYWESNVIIVGGRGMMNLSD